MKYETIELDLEDSEILVLALEAHRQDITLNQLMVNILKARLDEIEAQKSGDSST